MNKKNIIKTYVLILAIVFLSFYYVNNAIINIQVDMGVIVTFIFNGLLIVFGIIKEKRKFSLNKVFWYFNLFFFFLSPLCQYLSDFSAWNYRITPELYLKSNIALIIWNFIYIVGYRKYDKKSKSKNKINKTNKINMSKQRTYIVLSIEILAFILAMKLIGFSNLFLRSSNDIDIGESFINTILINFIRTVPVYGTVYCYWMYKDRKCGCFPMIISLFFLICLNYPASVTRYWIGAVYIGIGIIICGDFLKNRTFDYGLIITFAIVFPIFQLFKWYNISDILLGKATKDLINVYNNVDFDAYSMLARSFCFVEDNSIMKGKQLLSTLLFFIPRIIWKNKAVPTGELIAKTQGQFFTNLSCPLIGEAYVNFGYVGILIYAILFARILKKIDDMYWEKDEKGREYINYIYPFSLGLLIFILRGSFHPAIVYTFTFYLYIILNKIINQMIFKYSYYNKYH